MSHLVLIEAPGKLQALSFALKKIKLDSFHVLATQGHIMDYPGELEDIGIDPGLREIGRRVVRPQILQTIRQWADVAQRVLIATDADQEGDVLAQDLVEQALKGHPAVMRVRLRSLDVDGVTQAFRSPAPIEARDAWPGAVRRTLDRLVGATFSGKHVRANGAGAAQQTSLSVGRVQTGLLGSIHKASGSGKLPMAKATLIVPAADGREPFSATLDVTPLNAGKMRELIEKSADTARRGIEVAAAESTPAENFKPWCYGEGVLAIAEATGRSIEEVAGSMQRLYESGRMSYPRSSANGITAQGAARIARIADRNGVRIDVDRIARFDANGTKKHAHESAHPLGVEVDLSTPILLLSQEEAVLSMLARHLVACGQPHVFQMPNSRELPAWAQQLVQEGVVFKRKVNLWLNPWPRRKAEAGMRPVSPAEQALALLLENDLGRPSTQVAHAIKFAARGLLDEQMRLTEKAKAWIAASPSILLDPRVSSRIEKLIEQAGDVGGPQGRYSLEAGPPVMCRDLLEGLGLWVEIEERLCASSQARSGLSSRLSSGGAAGAG